MDKREKLNVKDREGGGAVFVIGLPKTSAEVSNETNA